MYLALQNVFNGFFYVWSHNDKYPNEMPKLELRKSFKQGIEKGQKHLLFNSSWKKLFLSD